MSIRPLYALRPLQAAPLLPAVLARIARTPTARLATVFRLVPKYSCPPPKPGPPCGVPIFKIADGRNLGEALYVDRLVTGSIIGTTLAIGCSPCATGVFLDEVV